MSTSWRCLSASKAEGEGAKLEMQSMSRKAREKAARYKAFNGRVENLARRAKS
jgi:hypothetical protein